MAMDLDTHWKAFGKKKGIKKEQWEKTKFAKYLKSIQEAVDEVNLEEELAFVDMSPPLNFQEALPEDPADTFSEADEEHLAFRQVSAITGKTEFKKLRPVVRSISSMNLFGTSDENITLDLVEE